jgi:hypothetical protein
MPVILASADYARWLGDEPDPRELRTADGATNGPAGADFLAIEQRWLSLARSYEVETVRAAPRRAPRSQRKQRGCG